MGDLFVTYEQSLALKELGFDVPCFRYTYIGDTGNNVDHIEEVKFKFSANYNADSLCISIPLKSQVFKWFDDNTFMDVNGSFKLRAIIKHKETGYFGLEIRIWRFDNNVGKWVIESDLKSCQFRDDMESYAIDKLIEIVKN